jgi:hypothetical protein
MILPSKIRHSNLFPSVDEEDSAPLASALVFFMCITGTFKLYPREEVREFLCRLIAVFKSIRIIDLKGFGKEMLEFETDVEKVKISSEKLSDLLGLDFLPFRKISIADNYRSEACLMKFVHADKEYSLAINDIANQTGMHIEKFPPKFNREEWHQVFSKWRPEETFQKMICISGEIIWFQHNPQNEQDLKYIFASLTDEDYEFADRLMKEIPDESFEHFEEQNPGLLVDFKRREKASEPATLLFDWNRFSPTVQEEVLKHLFPKEYSPGKKLEKYQTFSVNPGTNIVSLAWLYANDLIWGDKYYEIDPRYELKLIKFIEDDGLEYLDFKDAYDQYNIGSIVHLLKEA